MGPACTAACRRRRAVTLHVNPLANFLRTLAARWPAAKRVRGRQAPAYVRLWGSRACSGLLLSLDIGQICERVGMSRGAQRSRSDAHEVGALDMPTRERMMG